MKRFLLFFCLVLHLPQWVTAQQWAIKTLPIVIPSRSETIWALPIAAEYTTKDRIGLQFSPGLTHQWRTIPTNKPIKQTEYRKRLLISISMRKYVGSKEINRAWFFGIGVWAMLERNWTKVPIEPIVTPIGTYPFYTGQTKHTGLGGFAGKNIALKYGWFIESKLGVYLTRNDQIFEWYDQGVKSVGTRISRTPWVVPSVLVGYRW